MSKSVPVIKAKKIRNIKSARRLLANLIYQFQTKEVTSEDAKTLAYLLIKYSELWKVESFEQFEKRLEVIESKLKREE